ncbi:Ca2+-transporting ATPase [Clostridium tetanomorphum]|uniref:P-type Ca(2+) transporter n=1 Tax=Clostridium tetanomorphum TaxID=1553 RepID=A0A923E5D6_CLOTT|nr:calcium-translocating P-type ATPase [Clostridium tetanomorphum DSM 665]MBC2396658.1 calcium-translocating P-type ATPase, PMCA-type [Clostridium tetanomorphum]MBP1863989.1 Ca2+-transporting ATPase [Clostridium tetanomorphum]NRS85067.1 Ca2+-transporting ATPase [Clostridium tetanomorphum]NRZ98284.1 Ca2+-transporting ATPase [Clostridium tetanomorphum]
MVNEKELFSGLSSLEAERRLKKYGQNVLEQKEKISPIRIFLQQFNDFIIWVLIAATAISGFMGEKADAITILVIIIMNGILGFIQEFKTEKSLEALNTLAAPTAKVIRNGSLKIINAENIVIGDLVVIESGDRVPADCIIIEDSSLMIDESLLTGESVGVSKSSKEKENIIYMGTVALTGKAKAKVIATGMKTEMGKIADMLQSIEKDKSPLKEKLNSLGKVLVIICIIICIIVTITGISRGQDKYEMFLLGVSLAVAAIPEGLPAIVTVALALGVSRMLKKNALVRRLPAVETLGCTSVICSDKTGTLTENKMTVKAFYFNNILYNIDKDTVSENIMFKKAVTYCSDCNIDYNERKLEKGLVGDPTETALIKAFFNDTNKLKEFLSKGKRIYDKPFTSERKMMSVVIKEGFKTNVYLKGAPERVIARCKYILIHGEVKNFTNVYKSKVLKAVENMSFKALRCIAAAYKETSNYRDSSLENDLVFIGIAGIIDPPRKEVKDAVFKCKLAGIRPVMITGDHKNTAYAIGKELDIVKDESQVITGEELDRLNDKALIKNIDNFKVFARVNPDHKLRIVRAFKNTNNIVSMTGDGVNDAPAVKEADIGISMGISGTDVTKEASSMILLDDNFATIVAAVEEGRVIYDNIRKFIRYLLSCNLGEVLTMFLASLLNLPIPLLPIQILFVNLATDGLPAIALGVDPADIDIMEERPRPKNESIFARGLKEKILIRGSLIGICTVAAFLMGYVYQMDLKVCRTLALCTLVMSQLIHVFECRSERHSIFEIKLFTNIYLVGAVTVSIIMIMAILYIPFLQKVFHTVALTLAQWCIVIFFSGIIAFINSMYLLFSHRKK